MIRRVLLDLDDVCNRFSLHLLHFMGLLPNDLDESLYPAECGYDMLAVANTLSERMGRPADFTLQNFWDSVPTDFWATIPESTEFRPLLKRLEQLVGRDNICILTSTTKDPGCLFGKLRWIQTHMPPWMHRQYLMGPRKHFCAMEDALLIDDSEANVNKFLAEGGHAILVPRPWNSAYGRHGLQSVLRQLNGFRWPCRLSAVS